MQDKQAQLDKLRTQAAECELLRSQATDLLERIRSKGWEGISQGLPTKCRPRSSAGCERVKGKASHWEYSPKTPANAASKKGGTKANAGGTQRTCAALSALVDRTGFFGLVAESPIFDQVADGLGAAGFVVLSRCPVVDARHKFIGQPQSAREYLACGWTARL